MVSTLYRQQLLSTERLRGSDITRLDQYHEKFGGHYHNVAVSLGLLSEAESTELLARVLGFDTVSEQELSSFLERYADCHRVQQPILLEQGWLNISHGNDVLYLTSSPLAAECFDYLFYLGESPNVVVCTEDVFRAAQRHFTSSSSTSVSLQGNDGDDVDIEFERLNELASEAPVVNLVNSLISRALQLGASDLHIEPVGRTYKARVRIDGILREIETIPLSMALAVVSRLKILASLDIAEKRRPQDGRFDTRLSGISLDVRVSALPLANGESIVMRFLLQESITYELSTLGIAPDIYERLLADLSKTSGVILITGPTGSGKTTTLYSCLNHLNSESVKIITLENPVEYQLEGVNQIQIRQEIGFDFAAGLRSVLRQDPDIIMLGEIRDGESAGIAMQSSLTGHLVFSTLHTNDAPSAFTRLLDLDVPEYLIDATVTSVVAQRLARKLCACAQPLSSQEQGEELKKLETYFSQHSEIKPNLHAPVGCSNCGFTGFKGRVALIEYLPVDEDVRSLEKNNQFTTACRELMNDKGLRTLIADGCLKVLKGETTLAEVLRVSG